ncbi:MAG: hypothetical protein ABIP91_02815 [Sphingomicrobium sp.]
MAISTQLQFYVARAEQARADAEAATLDNVRDRCMRSYESWTQLAERAAKTERMRDAAHPTPNSPAAKLLPAQIMAANPPE